MPGILDSLSKQIYQGFRGKLRIGTLWRDVPAGGLDDYGDPLDPTPTTWDCQGFTDIYTDAFRARAGIPETDLKVCIFGASLPAGIVPQKDDKALMVGQWYQLRRADTDPASALWVCQAYVCGAPA